MLRIHFTGADLARTRVAAAPDPLWELVLSMHALRRRNDDPVLTAWKRQVAPALRLGEPARAEVDVLLKLNPPVGYFPDFLTPAVGAAGFDAGVEAVIATPGRHLRRDIEKLPAPAPELAGLHRGEAVAAEELGQALHQYRRVALDPVWDRVQAAFDADRAARGRVMADHGVEAMLAGLHPAARWHGGALEITGYAGDRDLHLGGRGITLVPSYFKTTDKPLTLADPELPPVLVYSIHKPEFTPVTGRREALASLVGRTRAAVLEVVGDGCTTGELARRLMISPAAASEHASVLRDSGLLLSVRDGNRVLHSLTPLGLALLG